MTQLKILLAFAVLIAGCPRYGLADCGHFYCHQKQYVAQQVVVQPYYLPVAYYAAGQDVMAEALAEKAAVKAAVKVLALIQQERQQLQQQQQAAPAPLPPRPQPVQASVFQKCAACHTGANAAGGLVLDGQTAVSCRTLYKFSRMFGQGKDVPPKMAAVVQGMTPQERGAMYDAIVDLVQMDEPQAAELPPPPPKPQGDLE